MTTSRTGPRRRPAVDPALTTDAEAAIGAAEVGAAVVLSKYGAQSSRHAKSSTDVATDADREAERAIVAFLRGARPDDTVIGEEYGATGDVGRTRRWLVDPLCGTLNFAARTPVFSTNVALTTNGRTVAAAVADPLFAETFWSDGQVAMLRRRGVDTPLAPSSESRLVDINIDGPPGLAFVGPQLPSDPGLRAQFGLRVLSTTLAVAWVAAGRRSGYATDGALHGSVHFTAGIAICQAAGCVVTDLSGAPLHSGRGAIIAADRRTHEALVTAIAPHLAEATGASPT